MEANQLAEVIRKGFENVQTQIYRVQDQHITERITKVEGHLIRMEDRMDSLKDRMDKLEESVIQVGKNTKWGLITTATFIAILITVYKFISAI